MDAVQMRDLMEHYGRLKGGAETCKGNIRRIKSSTFEAYIEENALAGRLSATAAINSLKEHFGWQTKEETEESFMVELSEDARRLGE